jgi:hypothetical protein
MTYPARLRGRGVQVLRPTPGGGPKRWQRLIRIPTNASRRILKPIPGKSQAGVEYKWKTGGKTYRVRAHDRDPSVVPTPAIPAPNALVGWVVRIQRGKQYMDPTGTYHPESRLKPTKPGYDAFLANETHIPFTPPAAFP